MGSTSAVSRADATAIGRQDWREPDTSVGDVLADIAKRVLWPENTAPFLATAVEDMGGVCSVRQAERYLGGHCEWSGDATAAVIAEILARKRMRNVKVRAR